MIIPDPRSLRLHLRVAGFLLVLLLLPSFSLQESLLAAQRSNEQPYALIAGTVWGPDDRPVYGVVVKIRRTKDKKPKWEVTSDHHGEFAQRVPPGEADYILTADVKHLKSADGRPLHLVQDVTVHVYQDEREDTGLHLTH
ncbi:MAG TPA: carboxypeptidase-like regulatory domain-containing protein [Candidatus Binatia bacterium]|nr:carboxypeptidase-like regulatory domain-containing protein [Candidatus Binatia bacterium]